MRVHFLDENHGWAVGSLKSVFETNDGGSTWQPVPAAAQPSTRKEFTLYHWIDFVSPRVGVITGASIPQRKDGPPAPVPAWLDPAKANRRPEWPTTSIVLETRDGGTTWKASAVSMFGRMTRFRYARDGRGLVLVEFHDAFEWPSEVYRIDLRARETTRVFREKNRAVTDVLLFPGGVGYLAAVDPETNRVHVLLSADLSSFSEMPVDAKGIGGRALFASAGPENLWIATDKGIILHFVPLGSRP